MKDKKKILWIVLLLVLLTVFSVSSYFIFKAHNKKIQGIEKAWIEEENNGYVLKWDKITNAKKYVVFINDDVLETDVPYLDISKMEKDIFDVKIRYIDENMKKSKESPVFKFNKKDYLRYKFEFSGEDGGYVITRINRSSKEMQIPDEYNQKPVVKLGEKIFYRNNEIEKITLGKNIKIIGRGAFREANNLTDIYMSNSLRIIEEEAFRNCESLANLGDFNSLEIMGKRAFDECGNLVNIRLPKNLKRLGIAAFRKCNNLETVIIPKGVESIPSGCFAYNNKLREVSLSQNVSNIGSASFFQCNSLKGMVLPDNLLKIGEKAFEGCSNLFEIQLPDSLEYIGELAFKNTKIINQQINQQKDIAYINKWVVSCNNSKLNNIEIKQDIYYIANGVFNNLESVRAVKLPNTLISIGKNNFNNLSHLREVVWGNNLTAIYGDSFNNCGQLIILDLPKSLVKIGANTFKGSMNYINAEKSKDDFIIIKDWLLGMTEITQKNSFVIPEGVEKISDYAFMGNEKIKKIEMPRSLKLLGIGTFKDSTLETIVLSSNRLVRIPESCFYACSKLKNIELTNSIKEIGGLAFFKSGLEEIVFPKSIEKIGVKAFAENRELKTVIFNKETVKIELATAAFYNAESLTELSLPNNLLKIPDWAFGNARNLEKLQIGANTIEIGEYAFTFNRKLKVIEFNNKLQKIGNFAFTNLKELNEIIFPRSLKYIGANAFFNNNIKSFIVHKNIEYIGEQAFDNYEISALPTLYMEGGVKESGFHKDRNILGCPMVFGVIVDQTGKYIRGFARKEFEIKNPFDYKINNPERKGYTFKGYYSKKNKNVIFEKTEDIVKIDDEYILIRWDKK